MKRLFVQTLRLPALLSPSVNYSRETPALVNDTLTVHSSLLDLPFNDILTIKAGHHELATVTVPLSPCLELGANGSVVAAVQDLYGLAASSKFGFALATILGAGASHTMAVSSALAMKSEFECRGENQTVQLLLTARFYNFTNAKYRAGKQPWTVVRETLALASAPIVQCATHSLIC